MEEVDLALAELDSLAAERPDRFEPMFRKGNLLRLEERFEEAVELCQGAAKQEFFNPDLYWNLARLHLGFGFKAEGVRYLRRGLMIDPAHPAILEALRDLGDRAAPVLTFLPRQHPVHRWLGAVRHTIITHRPLRWAS